MMKIGKWSTKHNLLRHFSVFFMQAKFQKVNKLLRKGTKVYKKSLLDFKSI